VSKLDGMEYVILSSRGDLSFEYSDEAALATAARWQDRPLAAWEPERVVAVFQRVDVKALQGAPAPEGESAGGSGADLEHHLSALHRLITSARMAITTSTQDDAEKVTARDLLDQAVELLDEEQERSVPRVVPALRAQIEAETRAKVADEISAMKLPWVNNDGFTEHLLDSVRMDAAAIARGEEQGSGSLSDPSRRIL